MSKQGIVHGKQASVLKDLSDLYKEAEKLEDTAVRKAGRIYSREFLDGNDLVRLVVNEGGFSFRLFEDCADVYLNAVVGAFCTEADLTKLFYLGTLNGAEKAFESARPYALNALVSKGESTHEVMRMDKALDNYHYDPRLLSNTAWTIRNGAVVTAEMVHKYALQSIMAHCDERPMPAVLRTDKGWRFACAFTTDAKGGPFAYFSREAYIALNRHGADIAWRQLSEDGFSIDLPELMLLGLDGFELRLTEPPERIVTGKEEMELEEER